MRSMASRRTRAGAALAAILRDACLRNAFGRLLRMRWEFDRCQDDRDDSRALALGLVPLSDEVVELRDRVAGFWICQRIGDLLIELRDAVIHLLRAWIAVEEGRDLLHLGNPAI